MKPSNECSSSGRNDFVPLEDGLNMVGKLGIHELTPPRSEDLELWVDRLREFSNSRGIEEQVLYQPPTSTKRESVPPGLVLRGRIDPSDPIDHPTVLDDPLGLQLDTEGRCYSLGVIEPDGTVYVSNEYGGDHRSRTSQWGSPMETPPNGDLAEAWLTDDIMTVLVIDGLGHGTEAFEASKRAREVVASAEPAPPDRIMNRIHDGISDTRGGAVFVARIEADQSQISYCSVGNIEAWLVENETRHLNAENGTVGYRIPELETKRAPFDRGNWLVCHTDGVHPPEREFYDEAFCRLSPTLNSVRIHDQFEKGTDDALVFVARS